MKTEMNQLRVEMKTELKTEMSQLKNELKSSLRDVLPEELANVVSLEVKKNIKILLSHYVTCTE